MPFKQIDITYFDNKNVDFDMYRNEFINQFHYYEKNDFNTWLKNKFKTILNDFLNKLSNSKIRFNNFVIIGKTENNFNCSIIVNDLFQAINTCINNSIKTIIKQKNGYIQVETENKSQGNINYKIFMLNDKGMKFKTADLNKPCYHKSIRNKII